MRTKAPMTISIGAALLLIIAGCGDGGGGTEASYDRGESAPSKGAPPMTSAPPSAPSLPEHQRQNGPETPGADPSGTPGAPTMTDRQIIRSGDISLTVESLDSAERRLSALVTAAGGYVSGSTRNRASGSALTGTIEVRVPSGRFDGFLDGVRRLGRVESEAITASDVTEEYIDLEARLKGQQQLEARILKLLEERPGKLADVVEIEQKLAEVRSIIEGIQGRLRFLSSRVAHSSLTVRMTEPGAIGTSDTDTFGGRMKRAFDQGTEALVGLLAGVLTLAMALLPFLVLGLVIWVVVRRRMKARRERTAADAGAAVTKE